MKQTEILTHATHVNGWFPAVYLSCMSQNFRLFHVSNLSVRNFRILLLMYPGSVTRLSRHTRLFGRDGAKYCLLPGLWTHRSRVVSGFPPPVAGQTLPEMVANVTDHTGFPDARRFSLRIDLVFRFTPRVDLMWSAYGLFA